MGVDTEPIFDEFILNLKSIDTDSHFDVLFKIIQDRLSILLAILYSWDIPGYEYFDKPWKARKLATQCEK